MTDWLPLVAGIGSAAVGGFCLAFSAVVMPALRDRPAADAAATMVAHNHHAQRPVFMLVFFGTALAAIATIVVSVGQPDALLRITGAALYLAVVALTAAVNVPLNRRLGATSPADRAAYWPRFDPPWTRSNHIRTVLAILGAVALLIPAG